MNRLEAVGISGTLASGKDTAAEHIETTYGWTHVSTSDQIRKEIERQGLGIGRVLLQDVADKLRLERGAGVLGGMAVESYLSQRAPQNGLIVSGLRRHEEFDEIKHFLPDSKLIFIDGLPEMRFEWLLERDREGDEETFEEFLRNEEREMTSDANHKIDLAAVREVADYRVWNGGSKEDLYARIDRIILGE